MMALGQPAFGLRTNQGSVMYVAAEDGHGMRSRVTALRRRHGDAPSFWLVDGVSDLISEESGDLRTLKALVAKHVPSMIVIDTLAMSFPGLEENSAEGMGKVVSISRSLTSNGAAVVLVHHDTKAQGATPRGHSLLNGALDVALQLFPRDEFGVVRGKLSKNRNGSCERNIAFKIDTEELGTDGDGDAITAALVAEVAQSNGFRRQKLAPSETAALRLLQKCSDGRTMQCPEDRWRSKCNESRTVSGSDNNESRRKATTRAIQALCRKGLVDIQDGIATLTSVHNPPTESAFDHAACRRHDAVLE
jgi:hypothetical protein